MCHTCTRACAENWNSTSGVQVQVWFPWTIFFLFWDTMETKLALNSLRSIYFYFLGLGLKVCVTIPRYVNWDRIIHWIGSLLASKPSRVFCLWLFATFPQLEVDDTCTMDVSIEARGQLARVDFPLPMWVWVIELGLSGLAVGGFIQCNKTPDTSNLKEEGFL